MKTENTLYEANETLRIVGMYSFLFYLVACAGAVYVISKDKIPDWFAIILCVIGFIFIVAFLAVAIFLFKTAKQSCNGTKPPESVGTAGTDNKAASGNCSGG